MTLRPRTSLAAATLALVLVSLTGCSLGGSDPAATEEAFFKALGAGDGEAALALTTLSMDDVECPAVVSQYGELGPGIAAAEVGDVSIDGDTAAVDFTYSVVSGSEEIKVTGTHTMVRDGSEWRIEVPESYRIRASVADDVVAQLSIRSGLDEVCAEPGNSIDIFAFPGNYDLAVSDPSGLFDNSDARASAIVTDDGEAESHAVSFISEGEREQLAIDIRNVLIDSINDCASSSFVDADCPDGLPEVGGSITVGVTKFTDFPPSIEVTSEDGAAWRFTASGSSFVFARDGVEETVPMVYSGSVKRGGDRKVELVLD